MGFQTSRQHKKAACMLRNRASTTLTPESEPVAREMPTPRDLVSALEEAVALDAPDSTRPAAEHASSPTLPSPALNKRLAGSLARESTEAKVPCSEEAAKPDLPQYHDILSSMRGRRVILDLGMLLDFLKIDVVCGKCRKGHILPTVVEDIRPHIEEHGLASVLHMKCTVCEHETTFETSSKTGSSRYYEVNTLAVLGEQNAGLAPAKVEKLYTSLGIEYTLHKTNHGSLQKIVGATVETMAKKSCENAFKDEVSATLEREGTTETVDGTTYVNIGATGDCAWPTRGSGHAYASFCGGFVLMGALKKKIMSAAIFSKQCATCEAVERTAEKEKKAPVYPTHDCFRGCRGIMAERDPLWRGSSKAMEPKGALCTALGLGKHKLNRNGIFARVRYFTADDDSNMIAALNDPKLMPACLRPAVIDYLNRMYRYVIKSVAAKEDLEWAFPEDEKVAWLQGAVMNVVDHTFGMHDSCGKYRVPMSDGTWHSWCGVDANEPEYKPHLPHGKFLDPNTPPGQNTKVKAVFETRLAKKEVLLKQLHQTDTNANESYNSMVVRGTLPGGKAQQNGQSGVFFWAHCHAIMMKNEGAGYRRDLCARLGIDPPESMYSLDERVQRQKERAAELRVTHAVKKKRRLVRETKSARNDPLAARFGYASQVGFGHDSRGELLDDDGD
ncbi:hypothetical protein CYMTET_47462 [Cymbomonas tetramitiformis]|uniref:Mutator-like transposase domain-containing protein n=1 Tax=Cymbomonas tetramitiformis TaxID=36881 RepID=A0AAE0BW47_9CHLO|nr:hypothetical protein CYMTET_47462 [Cymbomonas tetramitiformis]